ncbi:MAG TPA: GNAT family N-acetyltransferase [Caulobacteraceae bacterium]|nr:GNAT family N-acetyltransferase [Caulobacteraceae bacterium]
MAGAECTTERLALRRPTEADLEAIWEVHADPKTNQFNPAGPMATRDHARGMLDSWDSHWDRYGFGYWAVCERGRPDRAIGFGGVMRKLVGEAEAFNLYFRFRPEVWGNGFAGEMGEAALALAFDRIGAAQVLGLVRPANEPSIRALVRLGMSPHGELDDVAGGPVSLIYAIDAAGWRERSR